MNTNSFSSTLRQACAKAAALALAFAPLASSAQDGTMHTMSSPDGVTTQQIVHMTATVTAVDMEARTISLKGKDGEMMEMEVSDEVKRLNEIKEGDKLDVGYLESVGLEFREATPEEMKDPLKVTESSDKSAKGQAPAGAMLRTTRAVVTLEGMSRLHNTLTVRTPRDNYFEVVVKPGTVKWESLHIGQTMVGTYTETVVMSIDPVKKK